MQKTVDETDENIYSTTAHFYNGMEQRVSKIVDQVETKYVYSGRALLFNIDENNAKITENILSPNGQTIATQRFSGSFANEYYFINHDIRNSVMSLLDSNLRR